MIITPLFIVLTSIVGAVATYSASQKWQLSPVFSSALLSLLFAVMAPVIFGSDLGFRLSLAFFGASFVGMSSPKVLTKNYQVVAGGLIFGVIFLTCSKIFPGFGGGLGLSAFVSVIFAKLYSTTIQKTPLFV